MSPEEQLVGIIALVIGAFVTAFSKQFFAFISKLINSKREGTPEAEELALDKFLVPDRVREIHKIIVQAQKDAAVDKAHNEHSRAAITASAEAVQSTTYILTRLTDISKLHFEGQKDFRTRVLRDLEIIKNKLNTRE